MASKEASAAFKPGLVVAVVAWIIVIALAMGNAMTDHAWALAIGVIFGLAIIPFGVWLAKQAPSNAK